VQTITNPKSNRSLLNNILLAGVSAGALDGIAAIIDFLIETGRNPLIIFVYIASGLFGSRAYVDQHLMAVFGLLLHFLIAVIFSAFYFLVYPKLNFLHKNRVVSAVVYGVFVWIIMNLVVVPISIPHPFSFHPVKVLLATAILIICIGIPISFMAASFYRKGSSLVKSS
jgi:hypothetical protein